jgi:hypothetical protein
MVIESSKIMYMCTDEKRRIDSDRRIYVDVQTALYELLGNCAGTLIAIYFNKNINFKDLGTSLVVFTNDNGFSDEDEKAYHVKNKSGNNGDATASINGLGEALTIDRLIPKDKDKNALKMAKTISIKEDCIRMTSIGTFSYTKWEDCSEFETEIREILGDLTGNKNFPTGSLKIIPLSKEWVNDFENADNVFKTKNKYKADLTFQSQKFLNKRLREEGHKLYVNGEEVSIIKPACVLSNEVIKIEYSLYWDSDKSKEELELCDKHTYSLILVIDNISELRKFPWAEYLAEVIHLTSDPKKKLDLSCEHISKSGEICFIESGTIYLSVCEEDSDSKLDGIHVYLNKNNVNYKPIVKKLGGKAGSGGAFHFELFNGYPRFENHVSKNSIQYTFPTDKSNISPTPRGDRVTLFMRETAKRWRHYKPPPITNPETTEVQAGGGTLEDYHSQSSSASSASSSPSPDNLISPTPILYQGQLVQQTEVSEPYRKVEISDELKDNVWNRFFRGKFLGNCPCCNIKITLFKNNVTNTVNFGHIIAERNGGPTEWQNIIPVCRHCNQSMRTTNMIDWVKSKYSIERFQKFEYLREQYLTNSDDYAVNS